MEISHGLVNLMYFMLCGELNRIKGSRSNKRRKLLTCFTNSYVMYLSDIQSSDHWAAIYICCATIYNCCTTIYVVPPQSWGDRSDTKHSKCLLLGGRRLNQLTLIPKPKGSGGARATTAQVGPANKRNDTKRCLPVEASLRPGEAVPW